MRLLSLIGQEVTWRLAIGVPAFLFILCPTVLLEARRQFDSRPLTKIDLGVTVVGTLCAAFVFYCLFRLLVLQAASVQITSEGASAILIGGTPLGLMGACWVYKDLIFRPSSE